MPSMRGAETLATAVGLDMTGTWSATAAAYFSQVSKARVLEAVTEATDAEEVGRIVGMKKADMVEAAERLLGSRRWRPSVLRVAGLEHAEEDDGGSPATDDDFPSVNGESSMVKRSVFVLACLCVKHKA